jgi:hypothetical protein
MYPVWSRRWNTATGWPVISPSFWKESVERWNNSSVAATPLEEVHRVPLRGLILRPGHPTNLGHRREAIAHLCDISVRLPGIALCPVDAHPAVCVERICGDVDLIVSSCRLVDCAHKWIPFWFLRLE